MSWEKIDKFYLVLMILLVFMSVLLIFSVRGVISMFISSRDLGSGSTTPEVRVEKEKLNEASDFVFSKNIVKLNLPQ